MKRILFTSFPFSLLYLFRVSPKRPLWPAAKWAKPFFFLFPYNWFSKAGFTLCLVFKDRQLSALAEWIQMSRLQLQSLTGVVNLANVHRDPRLVLIFEPDKVSHSLRLERSPTLVSIQSSLQSQSQSSGVCVGIVSCKSVEGCRGWMHQKLIRTPFFHFSVDAAVNVGSRQVWPCSHKYFEVIRLGS